MSDMQADFQLFVGGDEPESPWGSPVGMEFSIQAEGPPTYTGPDFESGPFVAGSGAKQAEGFDVPANVVDYGPSSYALDDALLRGPHAYSFGLGGTGAAPVRYPAAMTYSTPGSPVGGSGGGFGGFAEYANGLAAWLTKLSGSGARGAGGSGGGAGAGTSARASAGTGSGTLAMTGPWLWILGGVVVIGAVMLGRK